MANLDAPILGSTAARGAIEHAGIMPSDIEESFFGCVNSAGLGQAPDRQVVLGAGCSV
jgi:acetyl-CoA C-acetyltransferase